VQPAEDGCLHAFAIFTAFKGQQRLAGRQATAQQLAQLLSQLCKVQQLSLLKALAGLLHPQIASGSKLLQPELQLASGLGLLPLPLAPLLGELSPRLPQPGAESALLLLLLSPALLLMLLTPLLLMLLTPLLLMLLTPKLLLPQPTLMLLLRPSHVLLPLPPPVPLLLSSRMLLTLPTPSDLL
jgi:hypothetical protein